MKQVVWITAGCVGSWAVVSLAVGHPWALLAGMLAPLLAAIATWSAIERAHQRNPAHVTAVLMRAFGAKMLFFGVYVVAVTRTWVLEAAPFFAAFAVYFLGLQVVMALLLRSLAAPQAS